MILASEWTLCNMIWENNTNNNKSEHWSWVILTLRMRRKQSLTRWIFSPCDHEVWIHVRFILSTVIARSGVQRLSRGHLMRWDWLHVGTKSMWGFWNLSDSSEPSVGWLRVSSDTWGTVKSTATGKRIKTKFEWNHSLNVMFEFCYIRLVVEMIVIK
jgi:hypothetical protein